MYNSNYMGHILISDYLGISSTLFVFLFTLMAVAAFIVATLVQRRVKEVNY